MNFLLRKNTRVLKHFSTQLSKRVLVRSMHTNEGKIILFGNEGRSRMLSGVCQIANAVQVTLGPKGRNVAIDQSYGTCKITKDGVTVAKSIDLSDKMEDMGAQLIKKVASQTNESAGDGTTTATILAREIFVAGYKAVSSGANPVDVQRGINTAAKHAIKVLKQSAKKIDDKDLIQVATISANNDPHIGALITKAMNSVGAKGIISVNKGQKSEDSLEVVKGFKFDKGMSNAIFMTDAKSQKAVFEEPLILVVESKVSDYEGIVELLDHARSEGKALVIIADEVEGAALSTLVLNRLKSGLNCCAIKPPSFGDNRRDMLSDIALATGATFVTKESGISIKDLKPEMLGSCEKMEVTMESTLMIKGAGDKNAVKKRAEELKSRIGNSSGSEYETDVLKRRLARLTDGIAVINVGGGSEVEADEKLDRVTDALNATQAAVDEGIVPGGGVALLYASNSLKDLKMPNADQKLGAKIVRTAMRMPAQVICDNAGLEGAVITGRLLEDSENKIGLNRGMDALTGKFCDMVESGIVDPVKVTHTALSDSSSISGVMITTEAVICEKPKDGQKSDGGNPMEMPSSMRGGMNPMGVL